MSVAAYETGQVASVNELLSNLRLFATTNATLVAASQQWALKSYITVDGEDELILHGKGYAGQDNVYAGFQTFNGVVSDTFGVRLTGSVGYDRGQGFSTQPGVNPTNEYDEVLIYCWANPINYWFIGNGRRLIIVTQSGTTYHAAYVGFFLSYYSPSEYAYPLMVGGSGSWRGLGWNSRDNRISNFTDPKNLSSSVGNQDRTSLKVRLPDGTWVGLRNSMSNIYTTYTHGFVYPHRSYLNNSVDYTYMWEGKVMGGDYSTELLSIPTTLYLTFPFRAVLGDMDGVKYLPGRGVSPKKTVTDGLDTWITFPNVWRHLPSCMWAARIG